MNTHPSGMPMERWDWPFKTDKERQLAARWYTKQNLNDLGDAPF